MSLISLSKPSQRPSARRNGDVFSYAASESLVGVIREERLNVYSQPDPKCDQQRQGKPRWKAFLCQRQELESQTVSYILDC